jgi:putative phosphoribosyl transferase
MSFRFRDRTQAGRFLADKLEGRSGDANVVVLALLRGGAPVGAEVARRLGAPLDVFLVRKLGAPGQEELAMGAIASGGVTFLNEDIIAALRISPRELEEIIADEQAELHRLENAYRLDAPRAVLQGRLVILVDDGLATGASMRAAVAAVREKDPARTVVAIPVAARDIYEQFQTVADEIIAVQTPKDFHSVGQWYEDFTQTTDDEVCELLVKAAQFRQPVPAEAGASYFDF